MATRTKALDVQTDVENGVVQVTATDQDGNPDPSLTVTLDIPAELDGGFGELTGIGKTALVHGVSERLQSARGQNREEEAYHAIQSMKSTLLDGRWKKSRGSSGSSPNSSQPTILEEAVARVAGISVPEAQERLASKSEEEIKSIRSKSKVKAEYARVQAERRELQGGDQDDGLDDVL